MIKVSILYNLWHSNWIQACLKECNYHCYFEPMTLLEIAITPSPEKHVELIQTLNSLLGNLQEYSSIFNIAKTENNISVTAELKNQEQLEKLVADHDFALLCGAINTLGVKSEILIDGMKQNKLALKLNKC